jgi:HSP20 family protein
MTESGKDAKRETSTQVMPFDNTFSNLRQEIENAIRTWSTSPWIPSLFDYNGIRLPLCEIVDKDDRYELHVEIPGMDKENVKVHAKSHSVEVSAEKSKLVEEKKKGHIYTERSESSFYRQIPMPEEIVPQKVKSKVKNGILFVELPKKTRHRSRGEQAKPRLSK